MQRNIHTLCREGDDPELGTSSLSRLVSFRTTFIMVSFSAHLCTSWDPQKWTCDALAAMKTRVSGSIVSMTAPKRIRTSKYFSDECHRKPDRRVTLVGFEPYTPHLDYMLSATTSRLTDDVVLTFIIRFFSAFFCLEIENWNYLRIPQPLPSCLSTPTRFPNIREYKRRLSHICI